MWGTSQGDRTLTGDEARLVQRSVGYLRDMITAGIDLHEPYRSSVDVFNRLQPTQQLAVLHEVAYGLLDPDTPILELTAVREATVYAIYTELISLIEFEIDVANDGHACLNFNGSDSQPNRLLAGPSLTTDGSVRTAIVAACQSCDWHSVEWGQEPSDLGHRNRNVAHLALDLESDNLEDWSRAIEFLVDQVLWDRDFDMEEIFADHDPAKIAEIKKYFGIHEDYFSTPAPDAYSAEYQRIDRELVQLAQTIFD